MKPVSLIDETLGLVWPSPGFENSYPRVEREVRARLPDVTGTDTEKQEKAGGGEGGGREIDGDEQNTHT
jgi:hypothetical protein